MPDIKFSYLYRDASNYKNFGEIIFSNPTHLSIEILETIIKSKLIDGQWFFANDWEIPELYFKDRNDELDHSFHEYLCISATNDKANSELSLINFLRLVEGTNWKY